VVPSRKVRVVGFLVAFFGVACVAFGLNAVFNDYDLGSEERLLFIGIPLVLGALALYSGLSVLRRGRL
jgi:drug/metabolite transporter (DMT)-like permease